MAAWALGDREHRTSLIRGFCEQGLIITTSLLCLGCVFHGCVLFSAHYMGKSALGGAICFIACNIGTGDS